jgi:hypothetical protein
MSPPARASPSLEQLQEEAKRLLRGFHAGDPDARRRLGAAGPDDVTLADARLAVAREHGFPSSSRLRADVARQQEHSPALQHAHHDELDYYDGRGAGLLASAQDGTDAAVAAFRHRQAPLTLAGTRTVIAREHRFSSWRALRRHVAALKDDGEPFTRAYRALEHHDVDGLRALLDRFPELVAAQGTNGNDLLGMATVTCDERLVAVLLERGADVGHGKTHGWTALHQATLRGLPLLMRMLLDAGRCPGPRATTSPNRPSAHWRRRLGLRRCSAASRVGRGPPADAWSRMSGTLPIEAPGELTHRTRLEVRVHVLPR